MRPNRAKEPGLSAHFFRHELQCPCCGRCHMHPSILAAVETLRALISSDLDEDTPLRPSSGFRCHDHNDALAKRGFAPSHHSQHLVGRAIDITQARGMSINRMAEIADSIPALSSGGIGVYDWGIHIDTRGYRARW